MFARSNGFAALALVVSCSLLLLACGSNDATTGTRPLTCDAGQFRLQGTLGGQSIDIIESSAGGGLTQVDTGELLVGTFSDPSAPPHTQMDLMWSHVVADGAATPAHGTLTLAAGPYAGQTLCAGASTGTTVTIYTNDNGVGFVLAGIARGSACDTPIEGTLAGCWR